MTSTIVTRAVRQYHRNQADAARQAEARHLETRCAKLAAKRAVIERLAASRRAEWGDGYADHIANMVDAAQIAGGDAVMSDRDQVIAARVIYSSMHPHGKLWQYLTYREQYPYLKAAKAVFYALQNDTA